MKTHVTGRVSTVVFALLTTLLWSSTSRCYELAFSTYFGGSAWEHARDVCVDAQGNIYVCGGTASRDFPTTAKAYDQTFNFGDTSGQECDAFVCKFRPNGQLVWATYLGGPGYDRAYGIEVDAEGYVYVGGRAGRGFPTTPGVFQPTFQGYNGGGYGGYQNAFVAKLAPDGSELVWASYVGVAPLCRDIAIDAQGDVYLPLGYPNQGTVPPADWFTNAYQKTPNGGTDCGVIKVSGDGTTVLWATWLGGSGDDLMAASVRVGPGGQVYIASSTSSTDFPTTPGAHDRTYNGAGDYFVACVTPDGSDLVYATYLGGSANEWLSTHNLAIDDQGNAYVALQTSSTDYPVTRGTLQKDSGGGTADCAITKLSPTGALLLSTYLGGSTTENADGVYVDAEGNVFVTGDTQSTDFPVTAEAFQAQNYGGGEAFVILLSANFHELLYSTYLGGPANDNGRSGFLGSDGSLYVTGSSDGSGWPVHNGYQADFAGGPADYGAGDGILAKLAAPSTITIDPAVTYQTITGWEATAWVGEPSDAALPLYRDALYDALVNDIGINRVRLEVRSGVENQDNWTAYQNGTIAYETWRARRYATINDNADPHVIDWSGFHFSEMDGAIEQVVNPLRALLEARGEKLYININYVAFTGQITSGAYLHNDPEEYAEFVLATYLHIRDKYGWEPDAWEILLEPDNVSQWNGRLLGEAIVACAARLEENGFDAVFIAPSNTNMGNAVTYFDRMMDVPGVLPYLHEFCYHRYGGVSLQNLQSIANRARQYGLTTSMLEWWSDSNTYRTLHEDLKVGNNSAWQQAVVRGFFDIDDSNPDNPNFSINAKTKFTRQYFKFVRPGAVRIGATSREEPFDPLAFINEDGRHVLVVKCDQGGAFSIGGLPAATYGIKYTTGSEYDVDLPDQTVESGQAVVATIPAVGVLTVYAKVMTLDGQPPSAPVDLSTESVESSQVALVWEASTDDVAVAGYKIYRDGVRIGFAQTNSFADASVEPDIVYTYEVTAYDAAGNESLLSEPLIVITPESTEQSDLLGYWNFDEGNGTSALDASGHDYFGRVLGATWVTGLDELALDFDGQRDYVVIQTEAALNNLEAITMAAWIYPRVDSHWHVLDKGDGDKRLYSEGLNRTLDGRVRYAGTHAFSRSVNNTIQLNTWQHVAMVWSRETNTTRLFHNGREVSYSLQDIGTDGPLDDTTHPLTIGARGALGEGTFFNGMIDEVRLYRRALTADEIYDLYVPLAPSQRRR